MKGYNQHRTCDERTVGYILLHHKKKMKTFQQNCRFLTWCA